MNFKKGAYQGWVPDTAHKTPIVPLNKDKYECSNAGTDIIKDEFHC